MHIPTATPGRKCQREAGRTSLAPVVLWLIAFGVLVAAVVFGTGCSRNREPKLTGRSGDAPVDLTCAWRVGYSYLIRLETEVSTDSDLLDSRGPGVHRVTFAQECLIKVTNSPRGDSLNLDLEVRTLEMERAKGEAVALSFNSAQGGETIDEHGYIPVLKRMVGGHLQCTVAPSGRVMNTLGLSEWVDQALGVPPGSRPSRVTNITKRVASTLSPLIVPGGTNAITISTTTPDPPVVVAFTNEVREPMRKSTRAAVPGPLGGAGAPPPPSSASSSSAVANDVARTIRGFFTPDLFRTMLEFHFIPPAPVRWDPLESTCRHASLSIL